MSNHREIERLSEARALSDSPWLGSEDLRAAGVKSAVLTIEGVRIDEQISLGGKPEDKATIGFKGKEKRMILNTYNRKVLQRLYGDNEADQRGKKICVYIALVRNPQGGPNCPGLRLCGENEPKKGAE